MSVQPYARSEVTLLVEELAEATLDTVEMLLEHSDDEDWATMPGTSRTSTGSRRPTLARMEDA